MKVRIRKGKALIHEGRPYNEDDVVDIGDDADRVKWLQDVGTADPVTTKNTRAGKEENSNG